MRRFWIILGIIILLVFVYSVLVGLGIINLHSSPSPRQIHTLILDDFEHPSNDLQWRTNGYVQITSSHLHVTHGKKSAQIEFLIPSQFIATPTPGINWQPRITLSSSSLFLLRAYNWSSFKNFQMDAFNPQNQPVTYFLKFVDSRSFSYKVSGVLLPNIENKIIVPINDLLKARLNLKMIRSVSFWVHLTKTQQPLDIFIDYVRLDAPLNFKRSLPVTTN